MICVYEASTGLEAHMILNLLAQEGIEGRIEGEYLQGAVGEIPAINVVRVVVNESDYEKAKSVISDWESKQPKKTVIEKPVRRSSRAGAGFLLGLSVGIGSMYWAYNSPITSDGIDHNGDGVIDEKWTYKDNRLSRAEFDRNFDGKVDLIYSYDRKGMISFSKTDDNFDGFFETVYRHRYNIAYLQESDLNQDGEVDYRVTYTNGVLDEIEILDPNSKMPRKFQKYVMHKLSSAKYDADGDGTFDVQYEYDYYEEIKTKSDINIRANTR